MDFLLQQIKSLLNALNSVTKAYQSEDQSNINQSINFAKIVAEDVETNLKKIHSQPLTEETEIIMDFVHFGEFNSEEELADKWLKTGCCYISEIIKEYPTIAPFIDKKKVLEEALSNLYVETFKGKINAYFPSDTDPYFLYHVDEGNT